jgi:hypothetical protein
MDDRWGRLGRAAWLALVLHLVAGLAMLLVLRRGLETNPDLADRLLFVASRRGLWTAAWLSWSAAALSILWLFASLAEAHPVAACRYALALCAAAVAADLSAETIELGLLPELAARGAAESFLVWHRAAVLLTGFLANGLYTLAVGVAAWATRRDYPAWTVRAGAGVLVSGAALSAAALHGSPTALLLANAALVPLILAWLTGVARAAGAKAFAEN